MDRIHDLKERSVTTSPEERRLVEFVQEAKPTEDCARLSHA